MQTWWLYLLLCAKGKTYTGTTTDVEARFRTHQSGKGARFTRAYKPIRILAARSFANRSAACQAEYQLKQCSAQQKREWARRWEWRGRHEGGQESLSKY